MWGKGRGEPHREGALAAGEIGAPDFCIQWLSEAPPHS